MDSPNLLHTFFQGHNLGDILECKPSKNIVIHTVALQQYTTFDTLFHYKESLTILHELTLRTSRWRA